MLRPFQKSALTVDAQLAKMKARGLLVQDEDTAKHYLNQIGYYRLCGYTLPFQNGGDGTDRHNFSHPVQFNTIIDRYIFDRKLRLLLLDAIEQIEVSIRSSLSNYISPNNSPHWYLDRGLFKPGYDHDAMIREVKKQISHNAINPHEIAKQDIFIRHYYDNYNTPKMPPSWMVFESISFGTISRIFKNLNKSKTKKICQPLNINHQTLSSWLHSTCYVRNLCAHHHRIWNKTLTITPAISRNHAEKFENNSKIYRVMVVFQIFLEKISLNNNWAELLSELLSEHPGVPIRNMGIPENWREKPFWRLSEAA